MISAKIQKLYRNNFGLQHVIGVQTYWVNVVDPDVCCLVFSNLETFDLIDLLRNSKGCPNYLWCGFIGYFEYSMNFFSPVLWRSVVKNGSFRSERCGQPIKTVAMC